MPKTFSWRSEGVELQTDAGELRETLNERVRNFPIVNNFLRRIVSRGEHRNTYVHEICFYLFIFPPKNVSLADSSAKSLMTLHADIASYKTRILWLELITERTSVIVKINNISRREAWVWVRLILIFEPDTSGQADAVWDKLQHCHTKIWIEF